MYNQFLDFSAICLAILFMAVLASAVIAVSVMTLAFFSVMSTRLMTSVIHSLNHTISLEKNVWFLKPGKWTAVLAVFGGFPVAILICALYFAYFIYVVSYSEMMFNISNPTWR